MSELATVEVVASVDDEALATVVGELDASNADRVLAALQPALTGSDLVIDATRLRYLDSAGVRVLYTVADTATLRGAGITLLVARDSPIRRVLALTRVDHVLTVEERS